MGEYNGGTRKRVPSLTERLQSIKDEHIKHCVNALTLHLNLNESQQMIAHEQVRWYIRSAVTAADLVVNEDNNTRDAQKAAAKQEAVKRTFHRPGRFGHG